jgi:hypothetical protein
MRGLLSRISAWIIYRCFIYFSRHVSFKDFQVIWNQAYQAHVEGEWIRLQSTMRGPYTIGYTNTKYTLGGLGDVAEAQQKGQQSRLIWLKPDSAVGKGEK